VGGGLGGGGAVPHMKMMGADSLKMLSTSVTYLREQSVTNKQRGRR